LESQHGEGKEEGQEESCEEEIGLNSAIVYAIAESNSKTVPARKAGTVVSRPPQTARCASPMTLDTDSQKRQVAHAALQLVPHGATIGVGTGTTVNCFIDALAASPGRVPCAVSSSQASSERLQRAGVRVLDLNEVSELHLYIDGADEANGARELIKGGGGALTREKIVAAAAQRFVCIIDESKLVTRLGKFPLPIEVIPMARELVARRLRACGGRPVWRQDCLTDNGNHILDVHGLDIGAPAALERELNQITGVVAVGLFAVRPADVLLIGSPRGVETR
jgi:ribose 5-phosphate isomerase A